QQALEHAPGQMDVSLRLVRLLKGPLEQPHKAAEVMDQLVQARGESAQVHLERALFRLDRGALDEAAGDIARARAIAPDDIRALRTAADVASGRGRPDEARDCLERVCHKDPTHVPANLEQAKLALRANQPRRAIDGLRQALKAAPDHTGLQAVLAEVYIAG